MADPKVSEGARLERKALREYMRRALLKGKSLAAALVWIMNREHRYNVRKGGLGR